MEQETMVLTEEKETAAVSVPENRTEIIVPEKATIVPLITIWNNVDLMQQAWKMANTLAQTTIIPQQYRGKPGDCLVAIDIANRLYISPLMVMQSSQIVQGNFTWKGQACRAFIDNCNRYIDSEYIEVGEKGKDSWGYYFQAVEKKTGKLIKGVTVTIDMAKKEGWYGKSGSKWQTIPELMLKYRAAAWFMRTECPDIGIGFLTQEEQEDISGYVDNGKADNLVATLDGVIGK
jgi:hypothetical protein